MQSLNITPEQFSRLLRDHNLTREQFISLYGLRPLVYTPELPGRAKLAFVLTGVLIFALALFGNALVVYVVTRSKAMRTVTNIFICSLALSDLLIAFFCIPVTMLQNISDNWLGGHGQNCYCKGDQVRASTVSHKQTKPISTQQHHGYVPSLHVAILCQPTLRIEVLNWRN